MKDSPIRWVEPPAVTVPVEMRDEASRPWFLSEALIRRGIASLADLRAFLDPALYTPGASSTLPDLTKTADALEQALRRGKHIGIWGDFDVDGQTSTAVLVHALKSLGGKVSYYIPVRARDSHGVALPAFKTFLEQGIDLVLTCDTGISAHEAASYAASLHKDFYVTDHHTLPAELPDAKALINPHLLKTASPLSYLCGVGVAYKLAEELLNRAHKEDEIETLLDLAALGTIADLAELKGDNRWLVQRGLERIRTAPRPAFKAMLKLAEVSHDQITEEQISFTLAPRLNAIGRLGDANRIIPFFLDPMLSPNVESMAEQLEALNAQRKLLCDQVFQAAQTQLSRQRELLDHPVLLLNHPNWPAGVLGIVASRMVELYHRPAILIANPPGEPARGSARSIEGIDITEAIRANAAHLLAFGGHPMAAGLSLDPAKLADFQRGLDQNVTRQTHGIASVTDLMVDAFLPMENLTMDLVAALEQLAPFGPGNPALVLASRNLSLQSHTVFGKTRDHLQLIVEDPSGTARKVLWWQGAGSPLPEGRFDLAYTVRGNNYRGQRSIQLEWLGFRPVADSLDVRTQSTLPGVEDFRGQIDPPAVLSSLQNLADALIFAEGEYTLSGKLIDRYHANPTQALVLWTVPPGRSELRRLLDITKPRQIYWFGVPTSTDQPKPFITRLSGLIRYAIQNHEGRVSISDLASATAQCDRTVRAGLAWLVARGHISIQTEDNLVFLIALGGKPNPDQAGKHERDLNYLLQETAAFRSYCQDTDLKTLLI